MSEVIPEGASAKLRQEGFALLPLPEATGRKVQEVFEAAPHFFALPERQKLLNRLPHDCGYLPEGVEYSRSPDRPDPIESFNICARLDCAVPRLPEGNARLLAERMLEVIGAFEPLAEALALEVESGTAGVYGHRLKGALHRWSSLQLNYSRVAGSSREFIHESHEDGHFLTIACATQPGLEIHSKTGWCQPRVRPLDQAIVMAGEIAWLLSGGQIQRLYHRVRRLAHFSERFALLFFADIDPQLCTPWVQSKVNAGVDIGARVLSNPTRFGRQGFSTE